MQILSPAGAGINVPVSVTVGGQGSIERNIFHYLPPTITDIQPRRLYTSGLDKDGKEVLMRLTGAQFATANLTDDVQIKFHSPDGTLTATPAPLSHDHEEFQFIAPAGQGPQAKVLVVVENQTSNAYLQFGYFPPNITSVFPPQGPTSGCRILGEEDWRERISNIDPAEIETSTSLQFQRRCVEREKMTLTGVSLGEPRAGSMADKFNR